MLSKICVLLFAASLLFLLASSEARAWGGLQRGMFPGAPALGAVHSDSYSGFASPIGMYPPVGPTYAPAYYGGYYGGGFGAARAFGEGYRAGVYRGR